jgi:hypothetical protein
LEPLQPVDFFAYCLLQVSEEHPSASFAEMSAIMGEKWKSVSEEERKPYLERYQIEKDIYLKVNHPRYP